MNASIFQFDLSKKGLRQRKTTTCEASDPNIYYPKIPQMMLACTVPDF